jgi:hypothetical protein
MLLISYTHEGRCTQVVLSHRLVHSQPLLGF